MKRRRPHYLLSFNRCLNGGRNLWRNVKLTLLKFHLPVAIKENFSVTRVTSNLTEVDMWVLCLVERSFGQECTHASLECSQLFGLSCVNKVSATRTCRWTVSSCLTTTTTKIIYLGRPGLCELPMYPESCM